MKILAICQYYSPEPFRISDICEELVRRGHEVTILTGVPNYPMGEIYPGYQNSAETINVINGVNVIRCKTIPRKKDNIHRLLNYFSYAVSGWIKAGKLENDYDVVFVNQLSPVMMAWPAIRYCKKFGKKVVMYCLDLWPASLTAGGMKSSSPIYKLFGWISKGIYKKMDVILITSKMFARYLTDQFGVETKRIKHLPQYAEGIFDDVGSDGNEYIDLMFAGNVGTAQSLETVIMAAKEVKRSDVRWHIVGDGQDLERIKKMAEDMENVIFYGRKPLEEMPEYYRKADAMLVTLMKDQVISLTLPGKVQTYMAAGKPIISAADGETKITVEDAECGFTAGAEDWMGLAGAVEAFADSDWEKLGKNSRAYFDANYQRKLFFDKLEKELEKNT